MAIDFFLNMEKEVITKEIVYAEIRKQGVIVENSEEMKTLLSLYINETYETLGYGVDLIKRSENSHYNKIETKFLGNLFESKQLLRVEFNKKNDLTESYKKAFKMIFGIMNKANVRALLNCSLFMDVCFFELDKKIIINKEFELWKDEDIKKELNLWSVTEYQDTF